MKTKYLEGILLHKNSATMFLEPLCGIFGKNMFLGFRLHFTRIYYHYIPTELNIHQELLYGKAIHTKVKVPEAQIP